MGELICFAAGVWIGSHFRESILAFKRKGKEAMSAATKVFKG